MKIIIKCILLWSLVASLMIFIFAMSAEPAAESTETSGRTLRAIFNVIYPGFKNFDEARQQEIIDQNQYFIRKTAHFSVYTLLGMLVSLAIAQHTNKFSLISYGTGTLYAISDEIHQLYVPGRSGQISDVLLDSAGVLLGCILIFIIYKTVNRKKA
ncbi:MAG: VanZ family protein [Clostridia bacterium]|nr:VanZ family protein [Clostridia bacterium]